MTPVRLVERQTVVRRLARTDAAALAADWSQVVEVTPDHRPGRYRLTARGWVGTFATPGRFWEVVPKLGWPVAARLLGVGNVVTGELNTGVRSALAGRLAVLMAERATVGLVCGYAEQSGHGLAVRGRIDFADAGRRTSVGHRQVADEFTADQPWNGWPLWLARQLLAVALDGPTRRSLEAAAERFGAVNPSPSPPPAVDDPRLGDYRPLLDWCRLVADALADGGMLVNLERLFESHLGRLLAGPRTRCQVPVPLGAAVELRPDFVITDTAGRPVAVWDAKWKPLTADRPAADDLHQVLGYAAALGVSSVGLIYPGRRFSRCRLVAPSGVSVTLAACRLTGDGDRLTVADDRLRRLVVGR